MRLVHDDVVPPKNVDVPRQSRLSRAWEYARDKEMVIFFLVLVLVYKAGPPVLNTSGRDDIRVVYSDRYCQVGRSTRESRALSSNPRCRYKQGLQQCYSAGAVFKTFDQNRASH